MTEEGVGSLRALQRAIGGDTTGTAATGLRRLTAAPSRHRRSKIPSCISTRICQAWLWGTAAASGAELRDRLGGRPYGSAERPSRNGSACMQLQQRHAAEAGHENQ